MSYTPGPWFYQTFTRLKEDDKPMQIITAGNGTGWKGEQYMNVTGIISEDDARLIAAAPDLFEALEFMVSRFSKRQDIHFGERCALKDALKAIAKAKGEA